LIFIDFLFDFSSLFRLSCQRRRESDSMSAKSLPKDETLYARSTRERKDGKKNSIGHYDFEKSIGKKRKKEEKNHLALSAPYLMPISFWNVLF